MTWMGIWVITYKIRNYVFAGKEGAAPFPPSKDATALEKDISPDVQGIKVDAEKKLESWGKPMGLPSPKRPSSPAKKHSSSARKKTAPSSSSVPPVYMDLGRTFLVFIKLRQKCQQFELTRFLMNRDSGYL